jgi:hypothetical protein
MYVMTTRYRWIYAYLLILWLALSTGAFSQSVEPITGGRYDSLLAAYNLGLIQALEHVFHEEAGYLVTGPLNPFITENVDVNPDVRKMFKSTRVMCPDIETVRTAEATLREHTEFEIGEVRAWITKARKKTTVGYRGVLLECQWQGTSHTIEFLTIQQLRWLLWAEGVLWSGSFPGTKEGRRKYAMAVSDYLYAIDTGNVTASEPKAADHGLPPHADLYAEPPDFVIQGYDQYLEYLNQHRTIDADFISGVLSFVPSDSLLFMFKDEAPVSLFPNREQARLQEEYRKFYARGGDEHMVATLSKQVFDTLSPGEYFFAVGVSGKVRFGRELSRLEVQHLEDSIGAKIPRANHAYLFPGEPVYSAGAFVVSTNSAPGLAAVNAGSGHYFYSNIQVSIRHDIAERSNEYMMTLGHLFKALDDLSIGYKGVSISKF